MSFALEVVFQKYISEGVIQGVHEICQKSCVVAGSPDHNRWLPGLTQRLAV